MIEINITPEEREKLTTRAKLYHMTLEEYVHLLIEVDLEEIDPQESLRQSLRELREGKVMSLTESEDAS